jgi:hypothetical protein
MRRRWGEAVEVNARESGDSLAEGFASKARSLRPLCPPLVSAHPPAPLLPTFLLFDCSLSREQDPPIFQVFRTRLRSRLLFLLASCSSQNRTWQSPESWAVDQHYPLARWIRTTLMPPLPLTPPPPPSFLAAGVKITLQLHARRLLPTRPPSAGYLITPSAKDLVERK